MMYFEDSEFYCKCKRLGCSGKNRLINPSLQDRLDKLRGAYGAPLFVASGLRCPEHNIEVGGELDSAHTAGLAVDLRCTNSVVRYELLNISIDRKLFNRIGIGKTFLHLDCDPSKAGGVVWLYS